MKFSASTFKIHHSKGFTLVDLLIAISVLAILVGVAVPSMKGFLTSNKSEAVIADTYHLFKFARETAILKGQRVHLCLANNNLKCSKYGGTKILTFFDHDENNQPDDSEVIKLSEPDLHGLKLHARFGFGRNYLYFDGLGRVSWTGSVVLCSQANEPASFNKVTWNRIGRIYKGVDLNKDGVIDDSQSIQKACA